MKLPSFSRSLTAALLLSCAAPAWAANTADMGLRVTAVSFRNGATGIYTISVANAGPSSTNDTITINVTLPTGITFLSGGGSGFSCSATGQNVSCLRTSSMSPGTVSFQFRVNVCSPVSRISTVASIAYSGDDNLASNLTSRGTSVKSGTCVAIPTPTATRTPTGGSSSGTSTPTRTATATQTSSVASAATDVRLSASGVGGFYAGGAGNYFIVVSNYGPRDTNTAVTVRTTLPTGLTYDSVTGEGWSCSSAGQDVSCTVAGGVAEGTTASLLMKVKVARSAGPTVSTTMTLDYAGDTDTTNNTARRPTTIRF